MSFTKKRIIVHEYAPYKDYWFWIFMAIYINQDNIKKKCKCMYVLKQTCWKLGNRNLIFLISFVRYYRRFHSSTYSSFLSIHTHAYMFSIVRRNAMAHRLSSFSITLPFLLLGLSQVENTFPSRQFTLLLINAFVP